MLYPFMNDRNISFIIHIELYDGQDECNSRTEQQYVKHQLFGYYTLKKLQFDSPDVASFLNDLTPWTTLPTSAGLSTTLIPATTSTP